jgi:cyclopropane-fatty-acyl-phospholipid synthase
MLDSLLKRLIKTGDLTVIYADGRRARYGDGKPPHSVVRLKDRRVPLEFALNPEMAAGELYMDGRLIPEEGGIANLLEIAAVNIGMGSWTGFPRVLQNARRMTRSIAQLNVRGRAKRNVSHHYDLSGALYDLFLDTDKQYSCAYFEHPGQSLEEAQAAKKRHIAAKLLMTPGASVLDIGSGWGGLGLYLASLGAGEVVGVTLSQEQHRLSRARAEAAGLSKKVDFRIQDYRELEGKFDRIVSIGMFEHVGVAFYQTFFRKLSNLLKDNGVALLHTIGRLDGPGSTNPWITKYIFPGAYSPALSEVTRAIEKAGLITTDVEILRLHYAETLRHWRQRFMANWDKAAALYDERFCRMWEFYLAGVEMGFRHQGTVVFQVQISKSIDAVPLTRDYMYDWEHTHDLPQVIGRPRVAAE